VYSSNQRHSSLVLSFYCFSFLFPLHRLDKAHRCFTVLLFLLFPRHTTYAKGLPVSVKGSPCKCDWILYLNQCSLYLCNSKTEYFRQTIFVSNVGKKILIASSARTGNTRPKKGSWQFDLIYIERSGVFTSTNCWNTAKVPLDVGSHYARSDSIG